MKLTSKDAEKANSVRLQNFRKLLMDGKKFITRWSFPLMLAGIIGFLGHNFNPYSIVAPSSIWISIFFLGLIAYSLSHIKQLKKGFYKFWKQGP